MNVHKLRWPALFIFGALLASFATAPSFASEGGESSGGGDMVSWDHGTAWFLGPRVIKTCYEMGEGFGAEPWQVEFAIQQALDTWKMYLAQKHVHFSLNKALRPTLNYEMVRNCDGTEDLKFLFGTYGWEYRQFSGKYYNPVAFAERISYDPKAAWGKGFIWVASEESLKYYRSKFPSWSGTGNLKGMLLHEIGHALGNGHVPQTIMDSDIANWIDDNYDPRLQQIDGQHFLAFCSDCKGQEFTGITTSDAFSTLVGRDPLGEFSVRVAIENDLNKVTVYLKDERGETPVPLVIALNRSTGLPKNGPAVAAPQETFKLAIQDGTGKPYMPSQWTSSLVLFGEFRREPGRKIPAILEFNMSGTNGPIAIEYFCPEGLYNVFQMDLLKKTAD